MQNFCGKCGAKLSSTLNFCTKCGTKIKADLEPPSEEVIKGHTTNEETKVEKESVVDKKSLNTHSYLSQNQSFDPKIKKISILMLGLFLSLLATGVIFNFPIQNSLKFDVNNEEDIKEYIEIREEARKLAEENKDWTPHNNLKWTTEFEGAQDMIKLEKTAKRYFPLINFNIIGRIALLLLIMIILTYASAELIKDSNRLKWVIILLNLIVGVAFAFTVTTNQSWLSVKWGRLEYYLSIAVSIFFCLLAFYDSRKLVYWIIVPAVVAFIYTIVSASFENLIGVYHREIGYLLRIQLSTLGFFLLRFLGLASYFILPSVTFYLFLREFIYDKQPQESLQNKKAL